MNLAAIGRGAAAQGFFIDTGAGAADSIAIAGQIVAKGAGGVSLITMGTGVTHGILMASNVVTAWGSQAFRGGVTLLNGVALQAGGDISFSSTIDGFGRLRLSAGRTITMAGDVGSSLPLQGITLATASRVVVGGGLVLDLPPLNVSAHHRHGVRGADEGGWSKISPSWRSAVAPS